MPHYKKKWATKGRKKTSTKEKREKKTRAGRPPKRKRRELERGQKPRQIQKSLRFANALARRKLPGLVKKEKKRNSDSAARKKS